MFVEYGPVVGTPFEEDCAVESKALDRVVRAAHSRRKSESNDRPAPDLYSRNRAVRDRVVCENAFCTVHRSDRVAGKPQRHVVGSDHDAKRGELRTHHVAVERGACRDRGAALDMRRARLRCVEYEQGNSGCRRQKCTLHAFRPPCAPCCVTDSCTLWLGPVKRRPRTGCLT